MVLPGPPALQPLSLRIDLVHSFGSLCGTQLRDAAFFGDDAGDYVVHPVGRHVAFQYLDTGATSFAIESERVEAITACAISRDRALVAVCERCRDAPFTQVSVYNLHSAATAPEQTLQEFGGRVGRLACVAFSPECPAEVLCLASVDPEFLLIVVDWRHNVVLGKCRLTSAADRVAFSLLESAVVSASGPSFVKLWRVAGAGREAAASIKVDAGGEDTSSSHQTVVAVRELVPFAEAEGLREVPSVFTDHAWLEPGDGALVVCAAEGLIHVLSSLGRDDAVPPVAQQQDTGSRALRILCTIDGPFKGTPLAGSAPLRVRCFAHGFVLGGSHGAVSVWEKTTTSSELEGSLLSHDFHHVSTVLTSAKESDVRCIDLAGHGEPRLVLLGFGDASIAHTSMDSLRVTYGKSAPCTLIAGGYHSGPIVSLDIATQRPILVSACRKDCSVRVWNYSVRRCELAWEFPLEEPTAVAIHPLGYFLAVSFSDKLRFMQVLANELKLHRELSIRGLRLVRFANGGHLLAAAQGKLVVIFAVRSLTKVATLRGHSQQVISLSFDAEDRTLVTCGEDGGLCEWSTQGWSRLHDHLTRGFEAHALAAGARGHAYVCLLDGARSLLRTFRHCSPLEANDLSLPRDLQLASMLHCLGPQGALVLAGASDGALHSFLLAAVPWRRVLGLHCGACTAVCLSGDARTAATAGEDGAIFVLRITGLAESSSAGACRREIGAAAAAAVGVAAPVGVPAGGGDGEVVMVNRGEIQARQEEVEALAVEAGRLKSQFVEDAAELESACHERRVRAQLKDQEDIQSLRLRYESLQQTATAKERESLRAMKAMEATHVQAADQLEQTYGKKVREESERFAVLDAELQELEGRLHALHAEARRQLDEQQQQQQQELLRRVREKDADVQKLKDLVAFSQHRFDVMLDQEGMEHDLEFAELNRRHQEQLEQQRLIEYKRKKEQDTLIRGLDTLEKDRERIRKEQEETRAVEISLRAESETLQRAVAALNSDRRDRETLLRDRELEIGAYKQKVSTLKKFKHVLDFRLREVAQSLQPKDQMIEQLTEQLGELEANLERQLGRHRQMEGTLRQKRQQVAAMAEESERLREIVKQRERSIRRFTTDLHALATEEEDTRLWPQGIRRIYRDHVDPKRISKDGGSLAMQELGRQIQVMQLKATSLAAKGKHTEATCRADIGTKMMDNTDLMQELDGLRVERRVLERQVRDLEFRVVQAGKRIAAVQGGGAGGADVSLPLGTAAGGEAPALIPVAGPAAQLTQPLRLMGQGSSGGGGSHGSWGGAALAEAAAAKPARRARTPPPPHASPEERRQVKRLLAAADSGNEQVQLQRLEHKLLRDHLSKLREGRQQGAAPSDTP